MADNNSADEAVEALATLGLKEYEAKCYVALTRLESGTARDISDLTEIPRTRVYDAMEDLEERGLIGVHHTSPKRFRAVPIERAAAQLREQYQSKIDTFEENVAALSKLTETCSDISNAVWSVTEKAGIHVRTKTIIDEATRQVTVLMTKPSPFNSTLLDLLEEATVPTKRVFVVESEEMDEWVTIHLEGSALTIEPITLPLIDATGTDDETPDVTVVMGDAERTLVRTSETGRHQNTERAICTDSATNSLSVCMRLLLGA